MANAAREIITYPGSNIKPGHTSAKLKSEHIKLSYRLVTYGVGIWINPIRGDIAKVWRGLLFYPLYWFFIDPLLRVEMFDASCWGLRAIIELVILLASYSYCFYWC